MAKIKPYTLKCRKMCGSLLMMSYGLRHIPNINYHHFGVEEGSLFVYYVFFLGTSFLSQMRRTTSKFYKFLIRLINIFFLFFATLDYIISSPATLYTQFNTNLMKKNKKLTTEWKAFFFSFSP